MKTAVIVVTLVVVVPPLVGLAYYYWRYRSSPRVCWKQAVLQHVRDLHREQRRLSETSGELERAIAQLADNAFARHLDTISLDRLSDYPDIGPATIERLRDAGIRRFSEVLRTSFRGIRDIGPVRATALVSAVRLVVKDARSRFDSGACPDAVEFRKKVDELRLADREEATRRERELAAIEIAIADTNELLPIVHGITFAGFLLQGEVMGLTEEMMARPLPRPQPLPPPPPRLRVVAIPLAPALPPIPVAVVAKSAPQAVARLPAPPPPLPPIPLAVVAKPAPQPIVAALPAVDLFRAELNRPAVAPSAASPEYPGLARMRAVIGFGFAIAKADGKVAQAERKKIRAYLDETFAHDPVLLRNIDPAIEQIEKAIPDEDEAVAGVRDFPISERTTLYRWAERIADASGERNQRERDALARIAKDLGIILSESERPGLPRPSEMANEDGRDKPGRSLDPRAILEIEPCTPLDADLIRRRYAMLTDKLDPVKAAAFGPEFARMAEEKRIRIHTAAETLIARFNEPLEKVIAPPSSDLRHNPDLDDVFGA